MSRNPFSRRRMLPLSDRPIVGTSGADPNFDPSYGADEPAPPPVFRRLWVRIAAVALLALLLLFAVLAWTAPLGKALEPLEQPAVVIEAADGTPIARRGQYKDAPVTLGEMPDYVPEAFIAIEDKSFYDHWGISLRGIARAATRNLEAGGVVQGGSTITQQLAKNTFLNSERSLWRKAQEAVVALWMEMWLTKQEILERYLSSVYFGEGAWGLRAAAQTYFAKDPSELTLGEAAMLAGMMKAPSRLAPTQNYDGARARGKIVIAEMKAQGLITDAEWRAARPAQLRPGRENLPVGSYFADWVSPAAKSMIREGYGEARVRTTLDYDMQKAAQRILTERLKSSSATQGALVAMRPDGRILAMVGGTDYQTSAFNRAVQAERQSGSAFKLFVYLAALRSGLDPNSTVEDSPVTIGNWSPKNYDAKYAGPITLEGAFAKSSNVAAARLADRVGVGAIQEAARDLGVEGDLTNDLTIALGTSQTNLLEMTAAYAAVAAGRYPIEPYGVELPEEKSFGARLDRALRGGKRRLDHRDDLLRLLSAVVERGTGRRADLALNSYGKTGTTSDYRDALFIGFVPNLIVGVWVGNDDNSPTKGVTGGNVPADIWKSFVLAASPEARAAEQRYSRALAERRAREREREERRAELEARRGASAMLGDIENLINGNESAGRRILERVMRGQASADDVANQIERQAEQLARENGLSDDYYDEFEDSWRDALDNYREDGGGQ